MSSSPPGIPTATAPTWPRLPPATGTCGPRCSAPNGAGYPASPPGPDWPCTRRAGRLESGSACSTADLVAAIDQAVADGVDVINYSVGSGSSVFGADELAFLHAAAAGVMVATAAGNGGPEASTIASPATAPWVTTVGAATHGRGFQGLVTLGDGTELSRGQHRRRHRPGPAGLRRGRRQPDLRPGGRPSQSTVRRPSSCAPAVGGWPGSTRAGPSPSRAASPSSWSTPATTSRSTPTTTTCRRSISRPGPPRPSPPT